MNIAQVRKANLRRVLDEFESLTAAAVQAGVTKQHLSTLLTPSSPFGEKTARKLEESLGLEPGRLDRHGEPGTDFAGLGDEELALARRIGRLLPRERAAVAAMVDGLLR